MWRGPGDADTPRADMQKKENVVGHQPTPGPHLNGADQGRGVRVLWQDRSGGAATCSEMGRLPTIGQGHVGSAPRPASSRRAAGLPLHQVARPRGSRRRLARDVHNLEVNTEQRAWGSARP
jgi:hypothetical protein